MFSLSCTTLGCKLNQLETDALAEAFERHGFSIVPFEKKADISIINTCTVTSKAEQKARRIIRNVIRQNPSCCVIVTGCYAQLESMDLCSLAGKTKLEESSGLSPCGGGFFIVSGEKKSTLLDLPPLLSAGCNVPPAAIIGEWLKKPVGFNSKSPFRFQTGKIIYHSRPFLKIQDGCDNECTYCRIRLARGKSLSLDAKDVLLRLRLLEENGFAEAVLTGVNIGQYSDSGMDFSGLLDYLLSGTKNINLRISSTYINTVTESFLQVIRHERVRPHFHLSLQSGSDEVLRRMGRSYTAEIALEAVNKIRDAKGDPFLACDIITGFPGESKEDFLNTLKLCQKAEFAYIHAFPYSPRPGTKAYGYKNRVSERESVARVETLINTGSYFRGEYIKRWTGRITKAVIEKRHDCGLISYTGITDNYLRVLFNQEGEIPRAGSQVNCRILPYPQKKDASEDARFDAMAELYYGDI